ncbi:WecB/TagA/CpsF family glycosyltransferase [Prescottella equi]|uniref:WecB/TagA/CpsF family glycosyltransferase n=1 Tax=Rhodococcus hoagii TaxID=43767 RepID=UPI00197F148C|nr:WecB/TagA/CpsF family glycosyltransferase [Prescottella equi]
MNLSEIVTWVGSRPGERSLLLNHNLHSAYLSLVDPNFAEAYALADRTIIDGFPILLLANRYRAGRGEAALPADYRCGSNDWIAHFGALPDGHRVALLGASPSSNAAAVDELAARFSHLTFRGWDGFAGVADLEAADFLALREFGPDLVLVGLGMPKQEAFIVRNWDRLPQALYATVGGAIDQISGEQKLAPRWLGKLRAEWLWRLVSDPRRLSHRYIVEPILLLRETQRRRSRSASLNESR